MSTPATELATSTALPNDIASSISCCAHFNHNPASSTVLGTSSSQYRHERGLVSHEETRGMNQQKSKIQLKMATRNCIMTSCKVCQIGYRSSGMDWQMKVFQNTETIPVFLTNYLQSREQKWYRGSIASSLTSRRTENAKSA